MTNPLADMFTPTIKEPARQTGGFSFLESMMRKTILAVIIFVAAIILAASAKAQGGPLKNLFGKHSTCSGGNCGSSSTMPAATTPAPATVPVSLPTPMPTAGGTAQAKAEQQAREGSCRHVGGAFAGGTAEGVGFSTVSADDSIRRVCFWGQKTPLEIGVARGPRGWHACVIFK